ncbi:ester cyclase [Lentisalinibacter sediminis]|uniref:ester cyclase n=1 Tax=Lentisalinibacter sediminis TaxID=2992237 RepID=UPI00386C5E3A
MRRALHILPLLLLPLFAGCNAGADDKALVRGYLQTLVIEGRWEDWDRYFAPGATVNGSRHAREVLSSIGRGLHGAFPDLTLEVLEQIAEDGRVATRVRFSGTHEGVFDATPPTGARVSFEGLLLDRIEDGRVVESRQQLDMLGLSRRVKGIAAGRGGG